MYHNNMREIRIAQGMTLEELAEKTGMSIGYLSHLEIGTRSNPSISSMNKIAEALGKTVSEVFFC